MLLYKILINGSDSVINIAEGDVIDPYTKRDWAFSTGRKAQAAVKFFKAESVRVGRSLENCLFTIQKGEFVPYEEAE